MALNNCNLFALSRLLSRYILELNKSEGIHDLGEIKWDMALCLLAVYLICYFSLWKGISTSGKVCIYLYAFEACDYFAPKMMPNDALYHNYYRLPFRSCGLQLYFHMPFYSFY